MRSDHSGWQKSQPERHVVGRRPPSPEEHERQRLAHESEAHQPNGGGLDWFSVMQKKNPTKAKQKQQTTPSETPFRPLTR